VGNSDKLEIGDFVLAVGSPFGLSHSVTYGIISAKGRRDLKLGDGSVKYQNFLQTDAAINPGNSGGPLLNLRGEVIGINTAIASSSGGSEGIGFSIPINMVMTIATQLIEQGNVIRAYLGVRLDSRFDATRAAAAGLPLPTGALVSTVTPNSPAAASDLRAGDVILKVNSVPVEDDAHLVNLVSLTGVGETVDLVVYRQGTTFAVKVRVGKRQDYEPE
jgi:serine protease Do